MGEKTLILAQVFTSPETEKVLAVLNDGIPDEKKATFCLGIAQAFIGLAARHLAGEGKVEIEVPEA